MGDSVVMPMPTGGGAELLAGINEDGESISAASITTDARWFVVRLDDAGPVDWWVAEATVPTIAGEQVFSADQRQTADSRDL